MSRNPSELLASIDSLTPQELKRQLIFELTRKKLGLVWEADLIERDAALNEDMVFPELVSELSSLDESESSSNLIIEGDNFDSLRLLKATHAGKIRVIFIDPPYNTGNKDWVYNDSFLKKEDRWKHSKWLEFMFQRMTLARDLLTPDGVILICINDENRARLELLMDEVMPGRRIGSFVWRSRTGGNDTKGAFLSDNHEHVLVYGNEGFRFSGDEKSYSMYRYEDERGIFRLSDLTKAHDYETRPNTYYPIHDPKTDIYYPCSPSRVWAYASKHKLTEGTRIRGKPIEKMIEDGDVWFPVEQRTAFFATKEELIAAIQANDVPHAGKIPLLWPEMEDLGFWVGKQIGFGRPALKKYKEGLKNETQPISSWLTPRAEEGTVDPSSNMPVVGTTEEGSKRLRDLLAANAFPYPKPPSLITALLSQATRPDDIVLDFFAGSGTTGEVVMQLNVEDGGHRKFILCSSSEANKTSPDKNICRDVCAKRIKAVGEELENDDGLKRSFAYLTLSKIEEADLLFEASPHHAYAMLCLRERGAIRQANQNALIWPVAENMQSAIVVCPMTSVEAISKLKKLNYQRLVVYTDRPDSLREALEGADVEVVAYPLEEALRWGQVARKRDLPAAMEGLLEAEQ